LSADFPPDEFDSWAETYDQSVSESGFPFEGYTGVLKTTVRLCAPSPGFEVLDLGAGTGNLSVLLERAGCRLWCLDFSAPMLEHLRRKLPEAQIAQADILAEWPAEFRRRYDRIVSAYTFHHFPLNEKVGLIQKLNRDHLQPGGRIVIGDLAFDDIQAKEAVRRDLKDEWDDEYYWLVDESVEALTRAGFRVEYTKISRYAGVFLITM
jgi:putative AdoMet-dependent methyltransferase